MRSTTKSVNSELSFFTIVHRFNSRKSRRIYSPFISHAGFKWRLMLFPRGSQGDYATSAYVECGGPVSECGSDKLTRSSPREVGYQATRTWTCKAKFRMELIHPSKWPQLNITDEYHRFNYEWPFVVADPPGALQSISQGPNGVLAPWMKIKSPRDCPSVVKYSSHTFCEYETDWGFWEFAPLMVLRPGMHADDSMNIAVKVRITIIESFVDKVHLSRVSPPSEIDRSSMGFTKLLDKRKKIVDQIALCDGKLSNAKSDDAQKALTKEIERLSAALAELPEVAGTLDE